MYIEEEDEVGGRGGGGGDSGGGCGVWGKEATETAPVENKAI